MRLRQIFEAAGKTAAMAFGRMNPPTIGHEKLVNVIASQKADPFLFVTQTQKPKTDPLPFNIKLQFAQAAFPNVTVGDENVKTIIQALQKIESMGYDNLIYVAGSDRIDSFSEMLNKYNGKDYTFKSIKVISAGERDPDAEGAEGMSASKMREAAMKDNFEAFAQGLPRGLQNNAKNVYSAVRTGMGIKELEPAESVDEGTPGNNFRVGQKVIYKNSQGQEFPSIVTAVDFDDDAVKIKSANNKPFPNSGGDIELVVDPGWKFLTPEPRVDPDSIIAVSPSMRKTTERVRDPEDWDEGNREPPNNMAVYINGKLWKVFRGNGYYADDEREMSQYYKLQDWARKKSMQTGKRWEVARTGAPATESVTEGYGRYWCSTDKKWKQRKGPKQKRSS